MSTDALSEVLSAVRLSGSVFFDVTAKSPWVAEAPPAAQIAAEVMPGAQHTIEYHVVTRGSCWIELVGDVGSRASEASAKGTLRSFRMSIRMRFRANPACAPSQIWRCIDVPRMITHCRSFCEPRVRVILILFVVLQLRRAPVQSAAGFPAAPYASWTQRVTRVKRSARSIHPLRHGRNGQQTGGQPEHSQQAFGTEFRRSYPFAYGTTREQQYGLARGAAGFSGWTRTDLAARSPDPRLDFGGTRLGSRCIPLGARRSVHQSGRPSADSVFNAMAHADGG
jgi:hypothetical protein